MGIGGEKELAEASASQPQAGQGAEGKSISHHRHRVADVLPRDDAVLGGTISADDERGPAFRRGSGDGLVDKKHV